MSDFLDDTSRFILEHGEDDTSKLLFSRKKYPGIDMDRAVRCIEARRKAASKLPFWHKLPQIDYPGSLSLEQCSSEATAIYKQRFVKDGATMADLTCGLGVDCFFMGRKASEVHCCEMSDALCESARHNFELLGADNTTVHNCEAETFLYEHKTHFDLIYADPARRGKASQRIYDITLCSPDISLLKEKILSISDSLLVKVSPMADITHTLKLLPETREVHVLSVEGECKEVLLLLRKGSFEGEALITAVQLKKGRETALQFTLSEERGAEVDYCREVGPYLFRPDKAVLKAGAFKLLSRRFNIRKLAQGTHLYTADAPGRDFPGRCYEVVKVVAFSKKELSSIAGEYPEAGLLSVNFPIDTEQLRKRMGIKEGGEHFIFATTIADRKELIICRNTPPQTGEVHFQADSDTRTCNPA